MPGSELCPCIDQCLWLCLCGPASMAPLWYVMGTHYSTILPCLITCNCAGKDWIKQTLVGAFVFPSLICGIVFLINFVAIYYHASRAIPFLTMVRGLTFVEWALLWICAFCWCPIYVAHSITHACAHMYAHAHTPHLSS